MNKIKHACAETSVDQTGYCHQCGQKLPLDAKRKEMLDVLTNYDKEFNVSKSPLRGAQTTAKKPQVSQEPLVTDVTDITD
jgi:hypothetical protein